MVLIELMPIVLGFIFVVNILHEYKLAGTIYEKILEGEACTLSKSEREQALEDKEQMLNDKEQALLKREEALKDKEQMFLNFQKKKTGVSNNSSAEQYAKMLKTRFR